MGARQSIRTTLLLALAATAVWTAVTVGLDRGGLRQSLLISPLFFALIFFTMLMTNRLTAAVADRVVRRREANAPPRGPAAPPPSSERPEHARRRRGTRRQRGTDRRRR